MLLSNSKDSLIENKGGKMTLEATKYKRGHPLFWAQVPLVMGYIVGSDLMRPSKIKNTSDMVDLDQAKKAMEKSAQKGSFFFKEYRDLKKAEREQANLDYHLLKMEIENPSERLVENLEESPERVSDKAKTLYDVLHTLDPKQNISLKKYLNRRMYSGKEMHLSLVNDLDF